MRLTTWLTFSWVSVHRVELVVPKALSVFHCSLLGFVGVGGTRGCAMLGGVLLMAR